MRVSAFEVAKGSNTVTTLTSFDFTNGMHSVGGSVIDARGNLLGENHGGQEKCNSK